MTAVRTMINRMKHKAYEDYTVFEWLVGVIITAIACSCIVALALGVIGFLINADPFYLIVMLISFIVGAPSLAIVLYIDTKEETNG